MANKENSHFRILIIEDNPDRIHRFRSWLPVGVKIVAATRAGKALGVLQRDRGRVYAGILLDHDLQEQIATESDKYLSATNLLDALTINISNDVPILIHSMNPSCSPIMANRLDEAGFDVTRIPMAELSRGRFLKWIEEAREIWEDLQE